MSYKDDITPGEWEAPYEFGLANGKSYQSVTGVCAVWGGPDNEETQANAQLIAEAGTVCNETGKTPYELSREAAHWKAEYYKLKQEQDEALAALRDIAEGRAYQPVLHASSRLRQIEGGDDDTV